MFKVLLLDAVSSCAFSLSVRHEPPSQYTCQKIAKSRSGLSHSDSLMLGLSDVNIADLLKPATLLVGLVKPMNRSQLLAECMTGN